VISLFNHPSLWQLCSIVTSSILLGVNSSEKLALPTGCVYDFPTSSEGKLPNIVDAQKKRQYTPFKIETVTDFKRRNLPWKQYTTPPEPILDAC
jgi:hypothetical protein